MTVWILTREVNDYDQEGEYFLAAFHGEKPSVESLRGVGVPRKACAHVRRKGGRVKDENEWFFLREYVSTGVDGRLQRVYE